LGDRPAKWPDKVNNKAVPDLNMNLEHGAAAVTFINHATILVQTKELTFLTDPVFSERVSPFTWIGPKRVRAPGISIKNLPKIDVVVISHNHYDHLDIASITELQQQHDPLFLIALGDSMIVQHIKNLRYKEMDWWEKYTIGNTHIHFLPAQHWSARGLIDRNLSLWGSFMIEASGFNTYFAGDTGYARHFKEIAQKFPKIDLALLPIGAYKPRWFMRAQHMDPADAIQAHQDLQAYKSIAVHFGTWQLTDEAINEPITDLKQAKIIKNIAEDEFYVMDNGETRLLKAR
jgi:L-ascorbate metabolism protein UlaG (beta-lactamase superfamily)